DHGRHQHGRRAVPRVGVMGLATPFTDAEIAVIREMAGSATDKEIGARLNRPDRSINGKRLELGLPHSGKVARPFTEADLAAVRTMTAAGKQAKEIAAALRRNVRTITDKRRELGLDAPPRPEADPYAAIVPAFLAAYDEG